MNKRAQGNKVPNMEHNEGTQYVRGVIHRMTEGESPNIRRALMRKVSAIMKQEHGKGVTLHAGESSAVPIPVSHTEQAVSIERSVADYLKSVREHEALKEQNRTFGTNTRAKFLPKEEQFALFDAWKNHHDERARERLILAFEPMIRTMAFDAHRRSNLAIGDLQNEARLALIRCLDLFDPSKRNSLATFALRPIQGALARYIMDMSGPCRIGSNAADIKVWRRFAQVRNELERELNRSIGPEDYGTIAERIGVKPTVIQRMIPRVMRRDAELDAPSIMGEDDGATRMDMLVQEPMAHDPMQGTDTGKAMTIIRETIERMPERDQYIINNRLMNDEPVHFRVIGERYNVSKERIRQIEVRAISMIRKALEREGLNATTIFR